MIVKLNNGEFLTGYAVYDFIPSKLNTRFTIAHMVRAKMLKKVYRPRPVGQVCQILKPVRFHAADEPEEVEAELVKMNSKTCWVRLADGNVVKRHLSKHQVL